LIASSSVARSGLYVLKFSDNTMLIVQTYSSLYRWNNYVNGFLFIVVCSVLLSFHRCSICIFVIENSRSIQHIVWGRCTLKCLFVFTVLFINHCLSFQSPDGAQNSEQHTSWIFDFVQSDVVTAGGYNAYISTCGSKGGDEYDLKLLK